MVSLDALAVLSVILAAMTGAVAAVLAYLFYIGLTYAKGGEGKHILRAIVGVWLAVAIHQTVSLWFHIGIASRKIEVPYEHFYVNIPVSATFLVASLYYLWATVRRNPPKNGGESVISVREGLHDGANKSR